MRGKPWNFLLHGLVAGCLAMASLTAAAAPFIYVANSTQNSVSVFDAVTLTVVATVPVGTRPFPLAVSPDGTRVVVGNSGSNNASIIETAGHTVIATIPVGGNPYGVAIDPTGLRAMMANYQSNNVSVIDLTTNTVRVTIPAGTNPSGVAYTPDGSHAYVTNGGANSISVIDTATETVVATIANVGTSPWGIVMNADGTRAYVANYSSANVSVIDTTTNAVVLPRIAVGNQPVSIGINGDGSWVYTSNSGSDSVSGIALATGNVTTIPVGVRPFCAAFHPDRRRFYVQNAGNGTAVGTMNVLDTMTNTITATVHAAGHTHARDGHGRRHSGHGLVPRTGLRRRHADTVVYRDLRQPEPDRARGCTRRLGPHERHSRAMPRACNERERIGRGFRSDHRDAGQRAGRADDHAGRRGRRHRRRDVLGTGQ
jgi:YVTN family beta-propeller protein